MSGHGGGHGGSHSGGHSAPSHSSGGKESKAIETAFSGLLGLVVGGVGLCVSAILGRKG